MWKSKSSQSEPAAPQGTPTGDAAASSHLTGTPTSAYAVADRPGSAGTAGAATPPASAQTDRTTTPGTRPAPASTAKPAAPAATPRPQGPGVVKRTTSNVKRVLLVVVGALAALFAVFNSQQVQVHWIFGDAVQSPLILVIAIAFVAGAIIGWVGAKLANRSPSGSGTGSSTTATRR